MSKNAVDVLLAILEKVPDAGQVERLIEPVNLLILLRAHGRSDEAIRAALKSKIPGELLLELLNEGHTAEDLLALLPPQPAGKPGVEPAQKGASKPGVGPASKPASKPAFRLQRPSEVAANLSGLNKFGFFFAAFFTIVPAMILAGFFPLWQVGSEVMWYGIATGGAALGGLLFAQGRLPAWIGLVGGALAAPGGLFLLAWWSAGRESVFHIELAAASMLGALPGVLVYKLLARGRATPAG